MAWEMAGRKVAKKIKQASDVFEDFFAPLKSSSLLQVPHKHD